MREDCLICASCTDEEERGKCYRRNVVYETFCLTCEEVGGEGSCGIEIIDPPEESQEGNVKRKREESKEENEDKGTGRKKRDFKCKYVGETGRSGYERGVEHRNMFLKMDESSHLLKHYLVHHREIPPEDLKFGMRVRNVYNTSLERQVGEAIAIDYELRGGKKMMNSKSEYNRCTLPRIVTRNPKEHLKEENEEKEEEEILKGEIRKLRLKKREELINRDMQNISMKRACLEIQNKNLIKWRNRREVQERKRKEEEKRGEEALEKRKRCSLASFKKQALIKTFIKEGKLKKEGKSKEWMEGRKRMWREYREENTISEEEEFHTDIEGEEERGEKEKHSKILMDIKEGKLKFGIGEEGKFKEEEKGKRRGGMSLGRDDVGHSGGGDILLLKKNQNCPENPEDNGKEGSEGREDNVGRKREESGGGGISEEIIPNGESEKIGQMENSLSQKSVHNIEGGG